jgi:hypothetical protein
MWKFIKRVLGYRDQPQRKQPQKTIFSHVPCLECKGTGTVLVFEEVRGVRMDPPPGYTWQRRTCLLCEGTGEVERKGIYHVRM